MTMHDELLEIADRIETIATDWLILDEESRRNTIASDLRALAGRSVAVPDGLSVAIWNACAAYEDPKIPFVASARPEHRRQIKMLRDFAGSLVAPPPPAAQPIAHGDSEREDADEAFEAIKHALEQWPESEPAILFLMGAVGPLGVITGGDIKWALSELDATDRAKAEQEGSDA